MLRPSRLSFFLSLVVTAAAAWLWLGDAARPLETSAPGRLVINHVNVIDPDSGALQLDRCVSIAQGLVQRVGPAIQAPSQVQDGSLWIEASGRTLIPGLADVAVFPSLDGALPEDRHSGGFLRALMIQMQAGVTTVFDLDACRAQIRDPQIQAQPLAFPRLRAAAGMLTSRGGWRSAELSDGSSPAFEVSSLEDLDQAFKSNLEDGATLVFASVENAASDEAALSPELLLRLGQLCRGAELPLVIHVEHPSKAMAALMASPQVLVGAWASETVTPELVAAMLQAHCAYAPALQSLMAFEPPHDMVQALKSMSDPLWLQASVVDSLENWPAMRKYAARFEGAHDSAELAAENVATLAAAGVPIVAGSMSGQPGLPQGTALRAELGRLVDSGLSPRQALAAATSNVGRAMRRPGTGCLSPGCAADLLLLAEDPSKGMAALRHPLALVRGGRLWRTDELPRP
jgi:imidazolonepropionase-like amidohydrolase